MKIEYDGSKPLPNKKHELFVQHIIAGNPDYVSYRKAGYNPKAEESARASASQLLTNPNVKARLNYLLGTHREKALITREKLIEKLYKGLLMSLGEEPSRALYKDIVIEDRIANLPAFKSIAAEIAKLENYYPKEEKVEEKPQNITFNIQSVPVKDKV